MSFLGKDIRLHRLLNDRSGKLLAVTVDHPDSFNAAMLTFLSELTPTNAVEIQRSQ